MSNEQGQEEDRGKLIDKKCSSRKRETFGALLKEGIAGKVEKG